MPTRSALPWPWAGRSGSRCTTCSRCWCTPLSSAAATARALLTPLPATRDPPSGALVDRLHHDRRRADGERLLPLLLALRHALPLREDVADPVLHERLGCLELHGGAD